MVWPCSCPASCIGREHPWTNAVENPHCILLVRMGMGTPTPICSRTRPRACPVACIDSGAMIGAQRAIGVIRFEAGPRMTDFNALAVHAPGFKLRRDRRTRRPKRDRPRDRVLLKEPATVEAAWRRAKQAVRELASERARRTPSRLNPTGSPRCRAVWRPRCSAT